ncbi:MAG: poly-gamma-glutamate biosynthesis protein PgsC/CapC [Fretibacterium sp.]|nr:poly-gamma-glutamate biosynthesis protein PgsC/CapC [Fretibacterium sp.]
MMGGAAIWETLTVGLGVFWGLVWSRRTGWDCGGLITPGLLALCVTAPARAVLCLVLGLVLSPVLALVSHAFGLFGRERVGAAMLLSMTARLALLPIAPAPLWTGWVVPGLIAVSAGRQGALMTVCGAVSSSAAAIFSVELLRGLLA